MNMKNRTFFPLRFTVVSTLFNHQKQQQHDMLTSMVQARDKDRSTAQVGINELRKQLTEDAVLMNKGFLNSSNRSVLKIHANQTQIHNEVKALQNETSTFVNQTTVWLKQFSEFNKNMEQLDDVELWAKNVESDLKTITSALAFVVEVENKST